MRALHFTLSFLSLCCLGETRVNPNEVCAPKPKPKKGEYLFCDQIAESWTSCTAMCISSKDLCIKFCPNFNKDCPHLVGRGQTKGRNTCMLRPTVPYAANNDVKMTKLQNGSIRMEITCLNGERKTILRRCEQSCNVDKKPANETDVNGVCSRPIEQTKAKSPKWSFWSIGLIIIAGGLVIGTITTVVVYKQIKRTGERRNSVPDQDQNVNEADVEAQREQQRDDPMINVNAAEAQKPDPMKILRGFNAENPN